VYLGARGTPRRAPADVTLHGVATVSELFTMLFR